MPIEAPNFVSVRLQDDDKVTYAKVHEALESKERKRLNTSDVYRAGIAALARQLKIEVK